MVIIVTGLVVLLGSATRAILNREDTFKLHVNFDNPGSLAVGSQVRISGIVGGRVSRVEFLCDENEGRTDDDPCIRVTVEIQARFQDIIHDDASFHVGSQGMLGEAYIDIDPGSHDRPPLERGAVVRGTSPPRLDIALARGSEVVEILGDVTAENRELIARIPKSLSPLLTTDDSSQMDKDRLENWLTTAHAMTEQGADAVSQARGQYIDNPKISRALDKMDEMTTDLDRDIGPALKSTASKLEKTDSFLSEISSDDQDGVRAMVGQISTKATEADEMATKIGKIVQFVEAGEGTLGSFMMKEQLYDDLHEMVIDLKHNPWKLLWKD